MLHIFAFVRRSLAVPTAALGVVAALLASPAGAAPAPAAPRASTHVFDVASLPIRSDADYTVFTPPLIGNFAGSDFDDVFEWAPGSFTIDRLAISNGDRTFTNVRQSVNGTYTPIVGNFGGDSHDDIFWYAPGEGADSLWISRGDGTWTKTSVPVHNFYRPFAGDFTGTGRDSIVWPGFGPGHLWTFDASGAHTNRDVTVRGYYQPIVADVADGPDGHIGHDIVWHANNPMDKSYLWVATSTGFVSSLITLPGFSAATILAGSFGGDDHDDLFAYRSGNAADSLSFGSATGLVSGPTPTVRGRYVPVVGDWDGDGHDDVFWGSRDGGPDNVWFGTGAGGFRKVGDIADLPVGGTLIPLTSVGEALSSTGRLGRVAGEGFDFADEPGSATDDVAAIVLRNDGSGKLDAFILYGLSGPA
jgi:hypothetical protein